MDFPVPRDFEIALFFERLWLLLNDPTKRNILRWRGDEKKFVILDDQRMQLEICPLLFQLCTWANFLQTLYACRFRRARNGLEFSHEVFSQRRLQTLTREERHELFRTELGYKPSRIANRSSLPDSWEDWLGPEIHKRTITNAAGNVQVTIVTPGVDNSTADTADVPRPRIRKNSLPQRHEGEDAIIDVENVSSEESSGDLPRSTPTTHRGSPSDSSTFQQHPTSDDDESTRNDEQTDDGIQNNGNEESTHEASTNDGQGDDSTNNNAEESSKSDNDSDQGSSNNDREDQGEGSNNDSDEEPTNQESSNNDEGQNNSDESGEESSGGSDDEEPSDGATSGNDEEPSDGATSGNDEELLDEIDTSPPVKTRRLRKNESPSKRTRGNHPSVSGPSTSAATNESSAVFNEDSMKLEDQSEEKTETTEIKREPIILKISKAKLKEYNRKRERDD